MTYHCDSSLFNYTPRKSTEVKIGKNMMLGADHPILLQSMTTTNTNDTEASVEQIMKIVAAGGNLVRLTTQGKREAQNMKEIKALLNSKGCDVPLVADVHFNPAAADVAATHIEKVRINPGNYVDPARVFKHLEYTEEEYAAELERLEKRFVQLLEICKEHDTAIRIGVNHGSLSDRIMSHYGDTPAGIVESCMEFLRICKKYDFKNVVVSIKASNTVVMVQSVRMLCEQMKKEDLNFPLHLGVTEAGEGEDGRIKSAAGIGALLGDGIGDTIRVSLSEPPEAEIPVAWKLASYVTQRAGHQFIPGRAFPGFSYTHPERRPTCEVLNIGGTNVPVVVGERLDGSDEVGELVPDYIYCGQHLPLREKRIKGAKYIVDAPYWTGEEGVYPAFTTEMLPFVGSVKSEAKFLFASYLALNDELKACLRRYPEMVVIAQSNHQNRLGEQRAMIHEMWTEGLVNPVIAFAQYQHNEQEANDFRLEAAADLGALLFDKLIDGVMVFNRAAKGQKDLSHTVVDTTAFGVLQATRDRLTRTEFISCPGCGRTLYDLPGTIARIKAATGHLKGLKIGIMGCIVNGPGEMADADYGYVGAGIGKVSLYRGKQCVERNIRSEDAVQHLLDLIENDHKEEGKEEEKEQ